MVVNSVLVFDREETHTDCTVQILSNSITGEASVGWWVNKQRTPGKWVSVLEDGLPEEDGCYIVLWRAVCEYEHDPNPKFYYEMVEFSDGVWNITEDIPQAKDYDGADILYWMVLPEKPEGVK